MVNESDVDKKIREQQMEIESLKAQLMLMKQQMGSGLMNTQMFEAMNQIQDDIDANENLMQES